MKRRKKTISSGISGCTGKRISTGSFRRSADRDPAEIFRRSADRKPAGAFRRAAIRILLAAFFATAPAVWPAPWTEAAGGPAALQSVTPAGTAFDPTALKVQASESAISFMPNGGSGVMDKITLSGSPAQVQLPANTFTRYGYIFRGWSENPNAKTWEFEDGATVKNPKAMTLYALWEPQMYLINFNDNGADHGVMKDTYAIYDKEKRLATSPLIRSGYKFAGWSYGTYTIADEGLIYNLSSGNTVSNAMLTVDAGKPKNKKRSFRSTQGSVVYEKNGKKYLVTAAILNDGAYNKGNLSHYENVLTQYDLSTGKAVRRVRNLPFDHGNSICYDKDNGHFYIAEGGSVKGYPSGVMELDGNLKEVREYNFPLLTHIWAIAYSNHHFYVIGRNDSSRNSFCVLNENMKTLSISEADEYYQNFSSQGIAADDNFIYAVSAGFSTYEWKSRQRINVFDLTGHYIGVWTLDIPYEAEDITVLDGKAYITTNEREKSTLYETVLPSVTLKAKWKKK